MYFDSCFSLSLMHNQTRTYTMTTIFLLIVSIIREQKKSIVYVCRCVKHCSSMAGQGILIIIIPNDLNNDQEKTLDDIATKIEHSKEYPCSACDVSLTSRFRHHISPKLNLIDAIWVENFS